MRFAPIILALLVAGCATKPALDGFDNSGEVATPSNTLAFIGQKVTVAQLIEEGPEDPSVIVLDLGFAARYRVLGVVHGEYDREFIDFVAYDHYGYPRFADRDIALIYLTEHEGALYHRKYQYDYVYATADGRYAGCGDPYVDYEEDEVERRPLEEIDFDPPVVVKIADQYIPRNRRSEFTAEEIEEDRREIDAYYAPPAFDVKNGMATCRMGAYPEELFRIRNETMFLPQRRTALCIESLGLDPSRYYGKDSSEEAKIGACVADMKAKGLP